LRGFSEQRDVGIVPCNVVSEKSKYVNFVKSPILVEIVEVNELAAKVNVVNFVKSPISLGIVDVK
jgi:hypothetical protein